MNRIFQYSLAVGISIFATGVFATTAGQDKPEVHVGDFWTLQHTNGLSNEKDFTRIDNVVEVTDGEIRTQVKTKGKPESIIATFTREWNPVDGVTAKFDPYLKDFDFPLQVGKKWESKADKMIFSSGMHGSFFLKGEVVSLEKITVPAGTFDAYKINVALEAKGNDENANIGHTDETIWYAPSVNHYVKFINEFSRDGRVRSKDIYEMLEYSLR